MASIGVRVMALTLAGGLLAFLPGESLAQTRSRDLITREEITNSVQRDLDIFQVIRSLRPHFLQRPRGVRSMGNSISAPVAVYVDGVRESDVGALRMIMAATVQEVRYLDPSRSESEFGISASGGALVVKRLKDARDIVPARDTAPSPPR